MICVEFFCLICSELCDTMGLEVCERGSDDMLPVCFAAMPAEEEADFEKLYRKYYRLVYAVALDILKDSSLAEDAAAESFLKIARSFKKISSLEYHKQQRYIVIVSRNTAIELLRQEKREQADPGLDAELTVSDKELTAFQYTELRDCLSRLTDAEADVVYLIYGLGFDHKETAAALGIERAAVRKRLQYARAHLKKLLKEGEK